MESDDRKLSRKELARQQRRAAYLRAKEFRATDPKQIAFKEAMKQRRREANEVAKERRKAAAAGERARREERQAERRATLDRQMRMLVRPASPED
jgi:hypothetical protein